MIALALLTALSLAQSPPARALSRSLTSVPRLAGTQGGERAARLVSNFLREAGFEVEFDRRVVYLSYPRKLEFTAFAGGGDDLLLHRVERFSPDRRPLDDVPRYNAWSATGVVRAAVVDVGRGLSADYAKLLEDGVEVQGTIALCAYGGSYRGVKAELAEAGGCVGLLLYSDPAQDGYARGPAWPDGPWKPGSAAQRGAISTLTRAPGDPSTPGWPSPAPGSEGERLDDAALAERLPRIPVLPIGGEDAVLLRKRLRRGESTEVRLDLDVPRELREIVNVIGRLDGIEDGFVVAGNHRDAWVRGAHDAGSGTVSLLRAAQHLGARVKKGWRPEHGFVLGFWDGEEFGLIGSTEWGEANADELARNAIAYVNADAVVSGTRFNASASPGLLSPLRAALERVDAPAGGTLWEQWAGAGTPRPGLPGSGSDYTVFLHHLGIPSIDVSFSGNSGGQYHTRFDDFEMMDRFLDPGWVGHELAGRVLAELLVELDTRGHAALDAGDALDAIAASSRDLAVDGILSSEEVERLAASYERQAQAARSGALDGIRLYQALAAPLADRPWYRNPLWAPGLETGYASETWPTLRAAKGGDELAEELDALVKAADRLGSELAGK